MKKIGEKWNNLGWVEFFSEITSSKNIFLAKPHGVINPSLLKEDLVHARSFSKELNENWDYVTNTEDVKIVNPFNLFYLKDVKKIKRLKRIIIFAPNPVNYFLIKLVSKIVKPDIVFSERRDFEKFLGLT